VLTAERSTVENTSVDNPRWRTASGARLDYGMEFRVRPHLRVMELTARHVKQFEHNFQLAHLHSAQRYAGSTLAADYTFRLNIA
jgi:hypothetical protein